MKFGMTDEQYSLLNKLVIAPLKAEHCQVYIFGSRARGTHHPHSDVDILFKTTKNHPIPRGFLSKVVENIEESRFPFIVELVNDSELASSYRDSVLSDRIEV